MSLLTLTHKLLDDRNSLHNAINDLNCTIQTLPESSDKLHLIMQASELTNAYNSLNDNLQHLANLIDETIDISL